MPTRKLILREWNTGRKERCDINFALPEGNLHEGPTN